MCSLRATAVNRNRTAALFLLLVAMIPRFIAAVSYQKSTEKPCVGMNFEAAVNFGDVLTDRVDRQRQRVCNLFALKALQQKIQCGSQAGGEPGDFPVQGRRTHFLMKRGNFGENDMGNLRLAFVKKLSTGFPIESHKAYLSIRSGTG